MRNLTLLIFCIGFGLSPVFTQVPGIEWQRALGGTAQDAPNCIIPTSDGGSIVAGSTNSHDGDVTGLHTLPFGVYRDFWVVKLNSAGKVQWKKCYGGTLEEIAYSIVQTTDGGYIVAGDSWSTDGDITPHQNGISAWVVKINSVGDIQWQKTYGGYGLTAARCIRQTADGGYIFAGYANGTDGDITNPKGQNDFWVVKIDQNGTKQWSKCYGGSRRDAASWIEPTTDGGYIVSGTTTSVNGDVTGYTESWFYGIQGIYYYNDAWIIKLNSSGVIEWQRTLGGMGEDNANSIVQANDGGYVFTGASAPLNAPYNIWNVKLNASGSVLWQKSYGGTNGLQRGVSVRKTSDGGYIFGAEAEPNPLNTMGNISCNSNSSRDAWFIKTNSNGDLIWQQTFGGSGNEFASSISETADGGFIASVSTQDPDGDILATRYNEFWILKLKSPPFNSTITISASADTVCPSATVTFEAFPTFAGSKPMYQWKKNGVNVGTNSSVYTASALNNGDTVYCVFTRRSCSLIPEQTVTSNKKGITVINAINPVLTLQVSANPSCAGSSVQFTAFATNATTNPLYQWKVNRTVVPSITGNQFSSSTLANGDTVICTIPSVGGACFESASDTLVMQINNVVIPTITASTNTISSCENSTVTFTTSSSNGGSAAVYTWLINGVAVGNGQSYSSASLSDKDTVVCTLRSNATCASPVVVFSNPVIVERIKRIDLTIQPFQQSVCEGTNLTIQATATNALSSTIFKWEKDGVNIGANSSTLALSNLTTSGTGNYTVTATNGACGTARSTPTMLTVKSTSSSLTTATICRGEKYQFAGIDYTTTGIYKATLVNSSGCDSNAVLNLTVTNDLSIAPMAEIVTVANVPVTLRPVVNASNPSYNWQPALYLNSTSSPAPVSTPLQDIRYKLVVRDGSCTDSAYVNIKVLPQVIIPNAFSPNGDGINDTWNIAGLSAYAGATVTVYDRYGSIVFASTGYLISWAGDNKGKSLPVGTYYFIIQLSTNKPLSGSVTILK